MSVPEIFPKQDSADFFLNGPVGKLFTRTTFPKNRDLKGVMVLCHPHPLFGGQMNNKVLTTVVRSAQKAGLATVRFNFRGVDGSEGSHGYTVGEIEDARAVLTWVKTVLPNVSIALMGFSFGSFIAASIAAEISPKFLLTIAPAVNHQPYHELKPIFCPWLVIQGDQDEVVPCLEVVKWHRQPNPAPDLIIMPNVSHFFHNHLIQLQNIVDEALSKIAF